MNNIHIIFESPVMVHEPVPVNTMLIFGVADDGPTRKPIYVESYEKAKRLFGNGSLAKAWYTAKQAGGVDIYLVRLNGLEPVAYIEYLTNPLDPNSIEKAFALHSKYGGAKYNDRLSFEIRFNDVGIADALILTNLDETTTTYGFDTYKNVVSLCEAINQNAEFGLSDMVAELYTLSLILTSSLVGPTSGTLKDGGDEDLSDPVELSNALSIMYENLYEFPASVMVLDCAQFGSQIDYLSEFAFFCTDRNGYGKPTIGVVAAINKSENQSMDDYINSLVTSSQTNIEDGRGAFLFTVAGEYELYDGVDSFKANMACAVGGLLTLLPRQYSVVNKSLASTGKLLHEFTQEQIDKLASVGINALRKSVKRNVVLCSDLTLVNYDDYSQKYLSNIRMSQELVDRITTAVDDFIGNPESTFNTMNMSSKVDEVLRGSDFVKQYDYSIENTLDGGTYGKSIIVDFVPVGEIKTITVSVSI